EVVRPWISRFAVWPYLEEFAREVEREAPAELGGRPDLVVGNYSDGNLVAALVAQRLGVTMCSIAHALEKTKYLLSALHWREMEETYHFSCQYTADLIAMNSADFVIASTYQEVAGTATTVGQYESYQFFSMPGLYRVVDGVDPYDPKFNVVSPGADPEIYFPYSETGRRLLALEPQLQALAFGPPGADARGRLAEPVRPILLSLARLDRIKNLTGLVEWFASDDALRARANLLVVGGHVDPSRSSDHEEAEQAARMHELFDAHGLDGCVRWVGRRLERHVTGELYRFVADRRGAFVQPALFEAFGLTVVEAMSSGLPTFATCHGGPSEIIEPDRSGYLIDPNDGRSAAAAIGRFLVRCAAEPGEWDRISRGALARVEARYTWKGYAERLMTLSRIYGFWKFVSNLERQETARYLSMLYHLQLRPLARFERTRIRIDVADAAANEEFYSTFDPGEFQPAGVTSLARPKFLAIVSSTALGLTLVRKCTPPVDGLIVEGPTAGGHNAPPRGTPFFDEHSQPIYGPKDAPDLDAIRQLGVPFWLAGSYGCPEGLQQAVAAGATGVQVGTLFAFCFVAVKRP
ncbi:glycosyltransferase, partial [Acidobacteria bacterium ACD]|nr:glycosyltransferase [Acidobacteria bacterium ACD]